MSAPLSPHTRMVDLPEPLPLDGGGCLPGVSVACRTWGRPDPTGGAVLICHALTGCADADAWWPGLLGPGRALDPDRELVVCTNALGSCYGTTGPASLNPEGAPWGPGFPAITVRDMVRAQRAALAELGVQRLRLVIGGSLGGMQALEWVATYPEAVEAAAVIAAPARHSAWAVALSEAQRAAIEADPRYCGGHYAADDPPAAGLAAARMAAMCAYRSPASFAGKFGRRLAEDGAFEVARYLRHQGERLVARFDANAYLTLTRAMDSHDLGRGRGELRAVLERLSTPTLVMAISSDQLYPPAEVAELLAMPAARLAALRSPHGHDAFLVEQEAVNDLVAAFRARPHALERAS